MKPELILASEADFDQKVFEVGDPRLKVVYLWGHQCPNCEIFARHFPALQDQLKGEPIQFIKVNVYEYPDLGTRFGLYGIPTFLLVHRGRMLGRMTSFKSDEYFLTVLREQIEKIRANEEISPFRVLSTRAVYENPWIKVSESEIINADGSPGIYGVVKFRNRAVGVVPWFSDGTFMLVGQHRFPLGRYSWEIPEGGSPPGEELQETARRELKEETGIQAENFERILEMHLSNSVTDEYGVVFLAQGLTEGKSQPEATEQLRLRRVSLDEAYAEINSGKITDSLTVAAILKLMLMRSAGRLS